MSARPFTADQLFQIPSGRFRCELVRGELRKKPLLGAEAGAIVVNFAMPLAIHAKDKRLGAVLPATGFQLARNPDTVLSPNVAFVPKERIPAGRYDGFVPGPPDLAVEVLSFSDRAIEVEERAHEWLAGGTRAVVIVNPRRRHVTLHHPKRQAQVLMEEDTLDLHEVVPGFRISIAAIFA